MGDQVQNSVVDSSESNIQATTRDGLDVSMPDVELASEVTSVQDVVINEGNSRPPNLIVKEGDAKGILKGNGFMKQENVGFNAFLYSNYGRIYT